jgi:hypothetical protein
VFAEYIKLLIQRPQIVIGSTTANWNTGFAPSGAAGATLVTIGTAGQWYRLNQFTIVTVGFNAAATVYVRAYMDVAGVNRLVIADDWPMPEEVVFLSWWFDAVDDGLAVPYEYRIKDW